MSSYGLNPRKGGVGKGAGTIGAPPLLPGWSTQGGWEPGREQLRRGKAWRPSLISNEARLLAIKETKLHNQWKE